MRLQHLIPGVQDHDGAHLATEVLTAKLEQGLTRSPKQQTQQETFIPQDQGVELVWQGQHGVKVGSRQEFRPPSFDPPGLGHGLTLGTVAIATRVVRVAFEAALGALLRMATELVWAAGNDGLHHVILSDRDTMCLPVGVPIEAEDVSNFPLGGFASGCAPRGWAQGVGVITGLLRHGGEIGLSKAE